MMFSITKHSVQQENKSFQVLWQTGSQFRPWSKPLSNSIVLRVIISHLFFCKSVSLQHASISKFSARLNQQIYTMLIYKCWLIRVFFPSVFHYDTMFHFSMNSWMLQMFRQQSLDHCESKKKEKSWSSGFFVLYFKSRFKLNLNLNYAFLKIRGNHSEAILSAI